MLEIFGVVVTLLTALLAEEAPPKWRRWLWALFVVTVIVLGVLQIRSRHEQEMAVTASQEGQKDLQRKLDASLLNQQYAQGRLDTMNELLGKIVTNSDPKQTGALLQGLLSTKSTLKKDTLAVLGDAERWNKAWIASNPAPTPADPKKMTAQEIDAQNNYWQKYSNEMFVRFGPRILAIVQRYGAIGVDVRMMEQQLNYGYVPQDVTIKLRAFADRIRDDGSLRN